MKKSLLTIWLFATAYISYAQTETAAKQYTFHSINQVGLVEGEKGSAFQLQTINGVQYRKWFVGMGTGLDYYSLRTIPLFADVRWHMRNNGKTPFIYADAGTNFVWKKGNMESGWYKNDYNNALYYDMGIGYRTSFKKGTAFTVSAGYTQKNISENRTGYGSVMIDIYPPPPPYTEKFNYQLRRLSIKAGLIF